MKNKVLSLVAVVLLLVVSVSSALAHEHREVGDYSVTFGWRVEPAYAGIYNGPEFWVEDADGNPVEGLEETLSVTVSFGGVSKELEIYGVWQDPGHYTADLLPTLPGDYSFQITGTIGEQEIDEVFTSADGEFSSIEPIEDVAFPSEMSLLARIEALEAQLAELMAE